MKDISILRVIKKSSIFALVGIVAVSMFAAQPASSSGHVGDHGGYEHGSKCHHKSCKKRNICKSGGCKSKACKSKAYKSGGCKPSMKKHHHNDHRRYND